MSVQQMVADAEAWNQWAAQVSQRALTTGLVSAAELAANHKRSQYHLDRLRSKQDKQKGPDGALAWSHPNPTRPRR